MSEQRIPGNEPECCCEAGPLKNLMWHQYCSLYTGSSKILGLSLGFWWSFSKLWTVRCYINERLNPHVPAWALRSSDQCSLAVPRSGLKTRDCAVEVVPLKLCNSPPLNFRSVHVGDTFKKKLKTHLCRIAFYCFIHLYSLKNNKVIYFVSHVYNLQLVSDFGLKSCYECLTITATV